MSFVSRGNIWSVSNGQLQFIFTLCYEILSADIGCVARRAVYRARNRQASGVWCEFDASVNCCFFHSSLSDVYIQLHPTAIGLIQTILLQYLAGDRLNCYVVDESNEERLKERAVDMENA